MIKTGIDHSKIVFLDIETVSAKHEIYDLQESQAIAWSKVVDSKYKDELSDEHRITYNTLFKKYAALYPEFGRIVCISLGYFISATDLVVQAFTGTDERLLLSKVSAELTKLSATHKIIGGWNIKQFDIPYMVRRSAILDMNLDIRFDYFSKKPWEMTDFLDIMEVWKAGATYLGSNSLESVSAAFGFKSPKESMEGSMVSTVFYAPDTKDGLDRIGKYCNSDVIYCSTLYVRMTRGNDFLRTIKVASNNVTIVE